MNKPVNTQSNAFNIAYDRLSYVLTSEVHITPDFNPLSPPDDSELKTYRAIWDTGATNSVITQKIVQEWNLKPIAVTYVNTANGQHLSNVYLVGIWLPNRVRIPHVRVTEGIIGGSIDVLIGMDIICLGDFAVTNKDKKTNFTFRIPSLECIDFVRNEPVIHKGTQTFYKAGRNEPCPCGSGKKFKRCHGANQ